MILTGWRKNEPEPETGNCRNQFLLCLLSRKCLWIFFSCLPGNLHWKTAGIFGEFFLVSVSHEPKHEKSSKIRGKFGAKFRAKFGTKIRKIRGTFVLQLFWPNQFPATESGLRTRLFKEPKVETEPPEPFPGTKPRNCPFCQIVLKHSKASVPQMNCRNQSPEPLKPFYPETIADPNRSHLAKSASHLDHFRSAGFELFWSFYSSF